jgi:hypothetical protein
MQIPKDLLTEEQQEKIIRMEKPVDEFIREAVDKKLEETDETTKKLDEDLENARGLWANRNFTGDEWQRRMRGCRHE